MLNFVLMRSAFCRGVRPEYLKVPNGLKRCTSSSQAFWVNAFQ